MGEAEAEGREVRRSWWRREWLSLLLLEEDGGPSSVGFSLSSPFENAKEEGIVLQELPLWWLVREEEEEQLPDFALLLVFR